MSTIINTILDKTMHLEMFENYLILKGDASRTIKQKKRHIDTIMKYGEFSEETVLSFLKTKRTEGCLISTMNKFVSSVKSYCEYRGYDWGSKLHRQREKDSKETVVLSDEQVESIINYVPLPNKISMYFMLVSHCAARPTEISTLTVDDISEDVVFIPDGKTGGRYVPIPQYVSDKLTDYLSTHSSKYLFPSVRDSSTHMSESEFTREFRRRREALHISNRARTYSLRHSKAFALGDCMSLKDLMDFLGHKKPETTMRYLRSNLKRLRRGIRKDPINRKFLPLTQRFEMAVKDIIKRADEEADVLRVEIRRNEHSFDLHIEIKEDV